MRPHNRASRGIVPLADLSLIESKGSSATDRACPFGCLNSCEALLTGQALPVCPLVVELVFGGRHTPYRTK